MERKVALLIALAIAFLSVSAIFFLQFIAFPFIAPYYAKTWPKVVIFEFLVVSVEASVILLTLLAWTRKGSEFVLLVIAAVAISNIITLLFGSLAFFSNWWWRPISPSFDYFMVAISAFLVGLSIYLFLKKARDKLSRGLSPPNPNRDTERERECEER